MKESLTTGDFNDHFWDEDSVQFARLIAELSVTGVFQDCKIMELVCASMDLTKEEIQEIVNRALAEVRRVKDSFP